MRIPLHLPHADTSREANLARFALHTFMSNLNPRGFRQMGKKEGLTTVKRGHGRKPIKRHEAYATRLARRAYDLPA